MTMKVVAPLVMALCVSMSCASEYLDSDPLSDPLYDPLSSYGDADGGVLRSEVGQISNIALGKPTRQSSTSFRGDSARAVDGNTSGRYGNNSVTHTNHEAAPWWRVDLGGSYDIREVVIYNRTDCCSNRLSDFRVDYLNAHDAVVTTRRFPGTAGVETRISLAAQGVFAVRVQLNGTNPLSLAEVQVFGAASTNPNIALGKPTRQSSIEFRGDSSRAVDGNISGIYRDSSVTHTRNEAAPWWRVDLGGSYDVREVVIYNRTDCCGNRLSNFRVDYLNARDAVVATRRFSGTAGAETRINLAAQGVFAVRVQLNGTNVLSLAEVQVFGAASAGTPVDPAPIPAPTDGPLDKSSDTRLRIASWNVFRGSVFPKTDAVWRAINNAGKYHVSRTDGAARILQAVDADIWLLQEARYSSSALPGGVTLADINRRLSGYMQTLTGDPWNVSCNGWGLCAMVRGRIRFDGEWNPDRRVAAHRVVLADGTRMLLVNVHFMSLRHAQVARGVIESQGSSVSAVLVGGDFNNGPDGERYREIDGIAGMNNLSIEHWQDPAATHVSDRMARRVHRNTKGFVRYGDGAAGPPLVTSVVGGQIDHFFLRSSSLRAGNRFVLNTLLFAPDTLTEYGLSPLDVVLQPQLYQPYFRNFLASGIVHPIPDSAYDSPQGLDHDHLPMIVDFTTGR